MMLLTSSLRTIIIKYFLNKREGSTEAVKKVITSVRDLIIEMMSKVDYDDVVVLSSNMEMLKD